MKNNLTKGVLIMETTLKVQGMTCAHCEASVKGALEKLTGVESVAINLDTGDVAVTYEEGKVTLEDMREAIEDQGYDVED